MAVGIHIVNVSFVPVDASGNVINKGCCSGMPGDPATIAQMASAYTHEHRVIPNVAVPNSAGAPTTKDYLELEAADNYVLRHMDQYTIITYEQP